MLKRAESIIPHEYKDRVKFHCITSIPASMGGVELDNYFDFIYS